MYTSVHWLNRYLDPAASAEEQADLLTRAGFPLEETEAIEGDVRQDYEMTSNRGDCTCHLGLAREIAAISGRTLQRPTGTPAATGAPAASDITVHNQEQELCPLYTARVIRGVTIRPSPQWLQDLLIARGDIPRNNVVDATNFVLFELGQPTHVFDLAKLKGAQIHIRRAHGGEAFIPIGEGAAKVTLTTEDLVIADAEDAVAMAGVKGGQLSSVTDSTTDIVLEAATFDPVAVRNSSRRHLVASDSSYRFERGVHPGQVHAAADRLADLILELAGGELAEGVVEDGRPIPEQHSVSMRPQRCRALLGIDVTDEQMAQWLATLEFEPTVGDNAITCKVPVHRLDIDREIDLIEEVGRMHGFDRIPVADIIPVRISAANPSDAARRAVHTELAGMGFVESVTHSLISDQVAGMFLHDGRSAQRVAEDRAADPSLRPSLLPSLLHVRRHNQNNGVRDLQLFESASTWWIDSDGPHEVGKTALIADATEGKISVRSMRGVIARIGEVLCGRAGEVSVKPTDALPWLDPCGIVSIGGSFVGHIGVISGDVQKAYDLERPVVAAELQLQPLFANYPPEQETSPLPSFPAIERDISAIVAEDVTWDDIATAIDAMSLKYLEATEFVTVYRGKQIGGGRKSLTFRCRFRAADQTLVHKLVDPQMDAVIKGMADRFSAEIRT